MGCIYCKRTKNMSSKGRVTIEKEALSVFYESRAGWNFGEGIDVKIDIKFCPMCGEKLTKK